MYLVITDEGEVIELGECPRSAISLFDSSFKDRKDITLYLRISPDGLRVAAHFDDHEKGCMSDPMKRRLLPPEGKKS